MLGRDRVRGSFVAGISSTSSEVWVSDSLVFSGRVSLISGSDGPYIVFSKALMIVLASAYRPVISPTWLVNSRADSWDGRRYPRIVATRRNWV